MDRKMFTSNPPVKLETDEKNRADVLHASALAMAKKMYDQQQKIIDSSARMHTRSSSFSGGDTASLASSRNEEQPPLVHNSLQEAAYRLAQERLANLQEEHDKQRGFQEYYGAGTAQRTKLGTIKGKLSRRRSSSDGDLLEDQRRSDQIRKQMSFLNNKVAEVPRTATVTASTPAHVLVLTDRGFRDLLAQSPSIATSILQTLGERLHSDAL
jgi:hypothetical protein